MYEASCNMIAVVDTILRVAPVVWLLSSNVAGVGHGVRSHRDEILNLFAKKKNQLLTPSVGIYRRNSTRVGEGSRDKNEGHES